MSTENNIGKSKILGNPNKRLKFTIADKAVTADKLADSCFTAEKLADGSITTDKLADGSVTLSKIASDISKSLLSLVSKDIVKIWDKIAEITGEQLQDLQFNVTPKYFISEDGATVNISASSIGNNAMFDYIAFYLDGVLIAQETGVETFNYTTTISNTTEISYKAAIMGTEYSDAVVVVHYNSYWMGSGTSYTDIMDLSHIIEVKQGLRNAYDIDFLEGDHFYIIIGESLRDQFIRADNNGFEIPFNESVIELNGNKYHVLESVNVYQEGTYNIDING